MDNTTADPNAIQEFYNQWQEAYKESKQSTCPNCGYCPHCGRGGYQTYPVYPQPYWQPYPWQPSITWYKTDTTT